MNDDPPWSLLLILATAVLAIVCTLLLLECTAHAQTAPDAVEPHGIGTPARAEIRETIRMVPAAV